jgi:hypothetical protein
MSGYSGTPLAKKLGIAAGDITSSVIRELALPTGKPAHTRERS